MCFRGDIVTLRGQRANTYRSRFDAHPVFFFSVLPAFVQSVEGALVNMTDDVQQTNLYKNCLLLGEKVKIMKSALKRPTGINIGVFVCVRA